ncbi:MAG TPA: AarF/UbiB family protein [Pyrinomonadaceae bacterium]|nr:AarF/UbiB family protein [Pyrinomonadaceae bacterium]
MNVAYSLRRLAHLTAVVVRYSLAHALWLAVRRWPRLARPLPVRPLAGPERLRAAIEEMGGTFIKFGQMLALQPDILPLEYCNALFNLLDRIAPFPFAAVEQTFLEEFGQSPDEIFEYVEHRPLATASIGQVHVARLGGRKVVVKVRRPSVEQDFTGDIRLMLAMMSVVRSLRLSFLYWIIEPMSEFVAWTAEELDYRREARYMDQQRRNAESNPRERVPEVYWDYVSTRTLVVEFMEGVNLLDYLRAAEAGDELTLARLRALGFDAGRFVYNVLENFLGDANSFGMFHADLHPANLLILPDNVVGYVDFGITGVLSRYSRRNVVSLTMSLGRGDLEGMCAAFFKISTVNAGSDVEGFRQGMRRLASGWYEWQGGAQRLVKNATLVMLDMLKLSRRTGIYPERDVVKYIRSAIAIDGLITRVAPGFNLGRHLELISRQQLARQARRSLLNYNSMLNWASSSGHLLDDGALRAVDFLQAFAAGETPARARVDEARPPRDAPARRRAVQFAAMLLVSSLLVSGAGDEARLGVNIFTAGALFAASAAVMLWREMGRPA